MNKLFVLVYSNQGADSKRFKTRKRKYYLPKGIIDNYNAIISGKNCYDQAMYSDIKRYEEIRKKKEIDADLKVNQQIKLIRQLKKLNNDNYNVKSMFILTKIKEAR